MKLILILISSLSLSYTYSFVPPESFDSGFISIENSIFSEGISNNNFHTAKGSLSEVIIKQIFDDNEKRINKDFYIPKYFLPNVKFWFSIYTQYTSHQVVIHDMNNLKLVYNVIDYEQLHSNKRIHRFSKSKLQSQLSLEYIQSLKKILKKLSWFNLKKLSHSEYKILLTVKNAGTKIPSSKKKRKKLFLKLANNLRTQTGQRDKIFKGVVRSLPYWPYLKYQMMQFKLPVELLAIAFLESSFNPIAKSKVAAAGVWQFMPYISNLFMPKITKNLDYRSNPIISSIAAFHLLKENKVNMRRWDLAVTAYNSGTKHLQKAIKRYRSKKLKRKDISLAYILKKYDHPHLGFASKNFYSEFLALVRVLAYEELIYPIDGIVSSISLGEPKNLMIYISKCRIRPSKFYSLLRRTSPIINKINSHFENPNAYYPRGSLIVSDRKLTRRKFHKVSQTNLKKMFPKKLYKIIKNKKCGS